MSIPGAWRDLFFPMICGPLLSRSCRPSGPSRGAADLGCRTRAALTGILFVLRSGLPWEMLPQEMGCGSGMTCWRRLEEWHEAGVWERLHGALLDRLGGQADRIDRSTAVCDAVAPLRYGHTSARAGGPLGEKHD